MRAWSLGLVLLAGCPAGEGGGPGGAGEGGGSGDAAVACDAACPEGTRLASWEAVIEGQGFVVFGEECEAVCEAITHCRAPTIPVLGDGTWACVALDGWSDFTPDAEVDFSWADLWGTP